MIKSTASKVMWVGRATVFLVGLAVILALVFGVASTAFAHKGEKGFFHLGHKNVSKAVSTLLKKGAGPALNLQVSSGPPLAVNSSEKVVSLNADQLDGKEASDFASAYKRTVVVSPTGTDAQNGTTLLDALSGITDASATKPYLLYIEAGTYDLGSGSLAMKQHVDIQGAGELKTLITSSVFGGFNDCSTGTVKGANNAELRFLTVRNTGGTAANPNCKVGIYNNSASPRLIHVTAESTVGSGPAVGVFNASSSSPTMTNVTATASGGSDNHGVINNNSSPTIKQSILNGSTSSLVQEVGGTAKVALTQLVGTVRGVSGSFQCFNNYDENMAAKSCP